MWFADDIDLLGGSEQKLQQIAVRLEKIPTGYGMEISSGQKKLSSTAASQGELPKFV